MTGPAICVRRSPGIDPLGVLTEAAGFSDPDKLDELPSVQWPEVPLRERRRGCLTVDMVAATSLGFYMDTPYVKRDTLIRVALEGRVPGWYAVEKIQDLTGLRAEGGAHIFLREKFDSEVEIRGVDAQVWVEDSGVVMDAAEKEVKVLEQIRENLDLGELDDLL